MAPHRGGLYVFEGADGVGKSALARGFAHHLRTAGLDCEELTFPGREEGTLGRLVYELHHAPMQYGVSGLSPASLQLLHVAAHIDVIERRIRPILEHGGIVILDRFWWSTMVYGAVRGVSEAILRGMRELELASWGTVRPTGLFLVRRKEPLRDEPVSEWRRIVTQYESFAVAERGYCPVHAIDNDGPPEEALEALIKIFEATHLATGPADQAAPSSLNVRQSLRRQESDARPRPGHPHVFSALAPAKPTPVFDTFWRFAAERQAIFFRRFVGAAPPWTSNPIFSTYKFTNAYRASDRVSQFLIRHVIYEGEQSSDEIFFRVILFKLFNRISTWQLLTRKLDAVTYRDYSFEHYDRVLTGAMSRGERIYSAAYIMPTGHGDARGTAKHRTHLHILERMMQGEVPHRIGDMKRMVDAFLLLRSYPMIGDFLAYQYVTDLNYSTLTDFSEMEFVVPGPGARDGIWKCFASLGGLRESDVIKVIADRQEEEFRQRGLTFQTLWGRPLQLIDCQNLFCEVDKYARIAHPDVKGKSERTRIKQRLKPNAERIAYWYPPKWGLNEEIGAGPVEAKRESGSDA